MNTFKRIFNNFGDKGFLSVGYREYKINKNYVRVLRLIILFYAFFSLFFVASHDLYYLSNPSDSFVLNPLYDSKAFFVPESVSSMEFIPPNSSYGYKMPSFVSDTFIYCLMIILSFGIANHLKFNKNWGG